jgi:glyceraldehyde 3-phosphate dehydrogenase
MVLECTGKFLTPAQLQGYFDRGVKRVIVAAPVKDERRAERRRRRQRSSLRPRASPPADGGVLHHQLPGPGGQGGARIDRHPPRPDHHDPRPDQHQRRGRRAAQGFAPRALGHAVAAADDDRQRHRHRPDLSRAQGQAERPRGARTGAERQPHRLRVRDCNARPRPPRSTPCSPRPPPGRWPASWAIETRPLVSADYANDTRSAIVDAPSTLVTDGTLLKVYAWYDNEAGYACRMVDLAQIVIAPTPEGGVGMAGVERAHYADRHGVVLGLHPDRRRAADAGAAALLPASATRPSPWPSCSCSTRPPASWPISAAAGWRCASASRAC